MTVGDLIKEKIMTTNEKAHQHVLHLIGIDQEKVKHLDSRIEALGQVANHLEAEVRKEKTISPLQFRTYKRASYGEEECVCGDHISVHDGKMLECADQNQARGTEG